MVRNYIRKTDRQKWSADDISAALKAVKSKAMWYKKAALTYNFPQSTLEDRVRKMSDEMTPEQAATKGMGRRKVFEKSQTKRGSKVVKKTKRKAETESEDDSEDEGDARCCYCKEKYSATKKADGWIQCTQCPNWAHEGCTKLPDSDLELFTCNKC